MGTGTMIQEGQAGYWPIEYCSSFFFFSSLIMMTQRLSFEISDLTFEERSIHNCIVLREF